MAGFSDHDYAAKFRDSMTKIAVKVVNRERPEPRLARVYKYDAGSAEAWVLFTGDKIDNLVRVRVPANLQPTQAMEATFATSSYAAPCDVVRVAGKPGSHYILGFHSGVPASSASGDIPDLPDLTTIFEEELNS